MLQVAPAAQNRPSQQRCPDAPHASQVLLPQVKPAAQKSPLRALQQRCPSPPQATHALLSSMVDGAVQSTPWAQRCWPGSPHWPPLQPPPLHVPWPCEQAAPLPTQRFELLSQQPPPSHWLPSQQGAPGVPHCRHIELPAQVMLGEVQKSDALLLLPAVQHEAPALPQVPHAPLVQVPRPPPHAAPGSRQTSLTQHAPALPHVLLSQHAWPGPPHATKAPPRHTFPAAPLSPLGTHTPVAALKHPPPAQALFAQGAW